jgi:hypothetical protein
MFSLLNQIPSRSSRLLHRVERFAHTTVKKALAIGINYYESDNIEAGSISDANKFADDLKLRFFFDVTLLTDSPSKILSRKDVFTAFDELLTGTDHGDILFIYFSGRSSAGNPMILSDGHVSRDELHSELLQALPTGVTLFMMFDSSYSNGLGLRYRFDDISVGPVKSLPSAQYRLAASPDKWTPKSRAFENLEAEETITSVIFLTHPGSRGLMTSSYLETVDRVYSHSLSLSMLLASLSAHYQANNCLLTSSIESGQYIDLNVPLGRLLAAPL